MDAETFSKRVSRTGGREATEGTIPGRWALSVGMPDLPSPRGWVWTPLSAVSQLESGHTPSRRHADYWDGGVPWVAIKDAVDGHGRMIDDTYQHVSELGLANSSARLLPPRTVCLSRTASVGYVVVMGRSMATSQDFVNWVCGPSLEPEYLKYVLLAERESLLRFASGTTHQTIYYPEAKAFHVLLPPITEQKEILRILGALDDKIELNRRMNETLEELARTIFTSWFVDFDPVRAKAEGRQPVGMDAETSRLFPSRFVESELGEMPTGWRRAPLSEWVHALSGGTPAKSDASFWGGGLPWISPKVMTEIHADEAEAWVTEAAVGNGTRLAPSGSTLVMVRGMGLHKCVRVSQARTNVTFNQDVKALVPREVEPTLLLLALLDAQTSLLRRVQSSGHGTGVLPSDILLAHPLCLPPSDLQKRLVPPLDAMNERIAAGRLESRTLAELRDLLLPKLVSGELRIPEAEKLVEDVA